MAPHNRRSPPLTSDRVDIIVLVMKCNVVSGDSSAHTSDGDYNQS